MENHRSLRDEQCLTLTAAEGVEHAGVQILEARGLGHGVLPAAALYGANASGKTNVLHALSFMRSAVLQSHRLWEPGGGTPQQPFALNAHAQSPSTFEVDIWTGGTRHRYGLILSQKRVEEEWLYTVRGTRRQTLFEREGDRFEFGRGFSGENETIRGLTRANSLFLSAAAQNNHAGALPVFSWFERLGVVMRSAVEGPRLPPGLLASAYFPRARKPAQRWPEEPDPHMRWVHDSLIRLLHAADAGIVDVKQGDGAGSSTLLFKHRSASGDGGWLPLSAQSAGTITLLDAGLALLGALRAGGVVLVDELEASLHPSLALEILRMFQKKAHNPQSAQLLFTTHDTNLLGNVLGPSPLRRDQVWFTEKDKDGATHLYPLTDFHPRKEENLERGYLQGRYGAIPFLGKLGQPGSNPTTGVHRLTEQIRTSVR
ncbi:MAG: ATP-binding protein [Polyangiaceae bacterium]